MEVERDNECCSEVEVRFEVTILRMNRQLKSFLRRFERDAQLVDDLVQDVYVEVLRSLKSFRGQSGLESWIYGVALNVGRQHVARQVTQRQRFVEIDEMLLEESCLPDVFHQVSVQQRLQRVHDRLRTMPQTLASTFEAYIEDGLTYQETARSLCIPLGTVRSRISRVRELVQDC